MKLVGKVTPPADMIEAARKSLSPEGFQKLMQATNGEAPTPKELCAAADQEHADHDHRAQRDPPQQPS